MGYTSEKTKTIGAFDVFRLPKLGAAFYLANARPASAQVVIEPSFYWLLERASNFSVRSLQPNKLGLIWSNADELRVLVDGAQPFGAQLVPSRAAPFTNLTRPPFVVDFAQLPDATPATAELRIDAYRNSALVGSRRFSADTSRDRFVLEADDDTLRADGADSTRVVLRVTDAFGTTRPMLTGVVRFALEGDAGAATLLGDNPFPLGDTGGAGAIWLRSAEPGRAGVVRLVATHDRFGAVETVVKFV